MAELDDKVLAISKRYYHRSWTTRKPRQRLNDANWMAYRCENDWSHKAAFQSRECTPMFPIAVEQIVGTFERALTDSDDWLSADPAGVGAPFLPPDTIKGLLKFYLDRLYRPGAHAETGCGIQSFVGDACKRGILEPCIVAKIYPVMTVRRRYRMKGVQPDLDEAAETAGAESFTGAYPAYDYLGETLAVDTDEKMRLAIDLIPYQDFFPDPSEANNFEIHRTRRQLHELLANPEYDATAIQRLLGRAQETRASVYDKSKTSGEQTVGADPFEIEVFEAWGNVIDEYTGEVLHENCFWSWAGDEIIRPPTPNPFWDGTRPFIVAPLIRVPGSQEHKALADHVVPMWRASCELVNLLLDGAMRAAWGVGQLRPDIMESPEEVAEGMPQGYTAVLKPNAPLNAKFYERVDNGEAPQLSLEGLARMEGYVQSGLAVPDTKLGTIPDKQVKATEIVSAMQASGSLYESFAARFEDTFLEPLFEKAWRIVIQWSDSFLEEELLQILGAKKMLQLVAMKPVERWQVLHKTYFKVRGLRQLANRERNFQKQMVLLQLLGTNQQFADYFGTKYSYGKLFDQIMLNSGVDPETMELEGEELAAAQMQPPPAQPIAGGQLDAALGGSSGASPQNITGPEANSGMQSGLAPANPNAGGQLGQ
jgi:hypothetical protein